MLTPAMNRASTVRRTSTDYAYCDDGTFPSGNKTIANAMIDRCKEERAHCPSSIEQAVQLLVHPYSTAR